MAIGAQKNKTEHAVHSYATEKWWEMLTNDEQWWDFLSSTYAELCQCNLINTTKQC